MKTIVFAILLIASTANAAVLPSFPLQRHPIATGCIIADVKCIAKYDLNVLDIATTAHSKTICNQATDPVACTEAYDMIIGDISANLKFHPVATECSASDRACIDKHDETVLDIAMVTDSEEPCQGATQPSSCVETFRMISGMTTPTQPKVLADPCLFVVRIDRGAAVLYSPITHEKRKVTAMRSWRPASFIGKCDLSKITSDTARHALPLFPWGAS